MDAFAEGGHPFDAVTQPRHCRPQSRSQLKASPLLFSLCTLCTFASQQFQRTTGESGRNRIPKFPRQPSQNPCAIFLRQASLSELSSNTPPACRIRRRITNRLVLRLG